MVGSSDIVVVLILALYGFRGIELDLRFVLDVGWWCGCEAVVTSVSAQGI
jgi:hypothetical protein